MIKVPWWIFAGMVVIILSLGALLISDYMAVKITQGSGQVIYPKIVSRILTNAPIKAPQKLFEGEITASTGEIVITKDRIIYRILPSGERDWSADLEPLLAKKGMRGGGKVEFRLREDGSDYEFNLNTYLIGNLTLIEGADGSWYKEIDNPGIKLDKVTVKKLPDRQKPSIVASLGIDSSGRLGGDLTWQPWGSGLGLKSGYWGVSAIAAASFKFNY